MKIKVYKTRQEAKLPVRAHSSDAGMDLFFCPDRSSSEVVLAPGETALFATGLKIEVPKNHMLQIMNKSGIASKTSLVTGACVVDSGYDGEVFVNLHNIGAEFRTIVPGQKIAQAVMIPISVPSLDLIEEDNIYGTSTDRGSGGFGSTGNF